MHPYLIGRRMSSYVAFGNSHSLLRNQIAEELRKRGFAIKFEKRFPRPTAKHKKWHNHVDIYAERKGEVVIVECGYTSYENLSYYKQKFPNGQILHYPYLCQWECVPRRGKHLLSQEEKFKIMERLSNRTW